MLGDLPAGLRAALVGTITDDQNKIPMARLSELRTAARLLDPAEVRGDDAVFAVQDAMIDVENLESALRSALEQHAHIVLD